MKDRDNYRWGHLDYSIRGIIDTNHGFIYPNFEFTLVTCVDSIIDIVSSQIPHLICSSGFYCDPLGQSIIIKAKEIRQIQSHLSLFSGFDEIWCCHKRPDQETEIKGSLLAPSNFDNEDPSVGVIKWMIDSHCGLALGDGEGMNFIYSLT